MIENKWFRTSLEQAMLLGALCLIFGQIAGARTQAAQKAKTRQQTAIADNSASVTRDRTVGTGTKGTPADPSAYLVGIEDELQISVWKEPELSADVVVRPDGKISVPLVNDIAVVGLSTDELQDLLVEKLKPFVNQPQVTVAVKAIRSRKVYLVGKALKPGTFPLNDKTTVLQLLADAGGLSPFAKSGSIYILRNNQGKQEKIPFHYKSALSGKAQDPVLIPGDMVVVP
ncbi:MAG TPA: polysaccharide biosynthesis/export family protein [Terriglobales bacterium]|jgi:polysaccharide export outer membrane protein|nr:polysaccharide biosynthesis/export family protein [Terriglobales bacterium]